MHFDSAVSLSTLLAALAIVITVSTAYVKGTRWLSDQVATFRVTLDHHASELARHSVRMDRYEQSFVAQATSLQRIIGRLEGTDRRAHVRLPPESA